MLYVKQVRLVGDDLLLYFDASKLRNLARQSIDLQVYGEYTDAEYDGQFVYFENAVLNGDLENWDVPPWDDRCKDRSGN